LLTPKASSAGLNPKTKQVILDAVEIHTWRFEAAHSQPATATHAMIADQ
jgi:hypothetical protein